mmetsp:Transcript_3386/g.9133  ORF Transcript_3386/g.9133 Transcript_3386/m.9133 type:complete len:406 (-) Transcript_3386:44-1261(-)
MPHSHSPVSRQRRLQRARDRGYLRPRPQDASFIAVHEKTARKVKDKVFANDPWITIQTTFDGEFPPLPLRGDIVDTEEKAPAHAPPLQRNVSPIAKVDENDILLGVLAGVFAIIFAVLEQIIGLLLRLYHLPNPKQENPKQANTDLTNVNPNLKQESPTQDFLLAKLDGMKRAMEVAEANTDVKIKALVVPLLCMIRDSVSQQTDKFLDTLAEKLEPVVLETVMKKLEPRIEELMKNMLAARTPEPKSPPSGLSTSSQNACSSKFYGEDQSVNATCLLGQPIVLKGMKTSYMNEKAGLVAVLPALGRVGVLFFDSDSIKSVPVSNVFEASPDTNIRDRCTECGENPRFVWLESKGSLCGCPGSARRQRLFHKFGDQIFLTGNLHVPTASSGDDTTNSTSTSGGTR